MGVLKGFRKYNRTLLAVFTAALMVSFLIGGTFKGCGHTAGNPVVARFFDGGYSVSMQERYAARLRWQMVFDVYQEAIGRYLTSSQSTRGAGAPAVLQAAFQAWRPYKRLEEQAEQRAGRAQSEMFLMQFGGQISDLVPVWIELGPAVALIQSEFSPTGDEVALRMGKAEAARRLGILVTARDVEDYISALGLTDDDLRIAARRMQVSPTPKVEEIKEALAEELLVIGHMSAVLSEVHVTEPQLQRFLRQNVDQVTPTAAVIDARDFADDPEFAPNFKDPKTVEELKKLYEAGKDKIGRRTARGIAEHDPFRGPQRETVFGYKLPDRAAMEILKVPEPELAKMTEAAKARIAALSPAARADFEERALEYYRPYAFRFQAPREKTPEVADPKSDKTEPKDKVEPKDKTEPKGKSDAEKAPVGEPKPDGDLPDIRSPAPKNAEKKADPNNPLPEKPKATPPEKPVEKPAPDPKGERGGKNDDKKAEPKAPPGESGGGGGGDGAVSEEAALAAADDKIAEKASAVGDAKAGEPKSDDAKDAKKDVKSTPDKPDVPDVGKKDAKAGEPKAGDAKKVGGDGKAGDLKGVDAKATNLKATDAKKSGNGQPPVIDSKKTPVVETKKTAGADSKKADEKTAPTPPPADPETREREEFAKVKEAVMIRLMIEDMLEEMMYRQTRPAYAKLVASAKDKDADKVPNFPQGLHPLVGPDPGTVEPKAPKRPVSELDVRSAYAQEFGISIEYQRTGLLSREDLFGSPLEQAVLRGAMAASTTATRNEDETLSLERLVFGNPVLERARRERQKKEREKQKSVVKDDFEEPTELHALAVGDVSPPMRGPVGEVYFVRLLAVEAEKTQTFEEASDLLAEDYALKKAYEFLVGTGEQPRGKAHDLAEAAVKSPDALPASIKPRTGRATTMHTLYNLDRLQRDALPAARSIVQLRAEIELEQRNPKAREKGPDRARLQALQMAGQNLMPLRTALSARSKEQMLIGWRVWLSKDNFLAAMVQAPAAGRNALPFELSTQISDPSEQQEIVRRAFALLEENPRGVAVVPLVKSFKVALLSLAGYQPAAGDTRGQREVWAGQARSLAAQQLLADYSDPVKLRAMLGYVSTEEEPDKAPETAATSGR